MTNSHIKQSPFVGYAGFGGGVGALSAKSSASKTYVDDVFSTYLYKGNNGAHQIVNGIDNTEGGLIWFKARDSGIDNALVDTVNGSGKYLVSNTYNAFSFADNINTFNNNGFTLQGGHSTVNDSWEGDYSSWNFRKAPGFFDIVTYTGNNTNRTISHSLGSVPGCIIIKCTQSGTTRDWMVWHRDLEDPTTCFLKLNSTTSRLSTGYVWNETLPTATGFTLGDYDLVNANGNTYVAYIFAGGEEQGNASVDFSGTDDRLTWDSNSDVNFGTGDFTVEFWLRKPDGGSTHRGFFQISGTGGGLTTTYGSSLGLGWHQSFNCWQLYRGGGYTNSSSFTPTSNQWYHAAVVRSSGTTKVYIDGTEVISLSDTHDYNYNNLVVGGYYNTSYLMKGNISNFRITKGQALYTSSFTPTTSPLTTTSQSATASNVKLLCCNDIGASGNTKSPVPLTLTGSPQGSTVSPFAASTATDAGAVFGGDSDKNIIQCGSYLGNTSSTGPVLNLGWEPQWIMIKKATGSTTSADWYILDSMRGIVSGDDDAILEANSNGAESANPWNLGKLTSSGFQLEQSGSSVNESGEQYVYMAIRRPDGYVGKPAEAGTDAFAMDTGAASSTIPNFDSGFPVDFVLARTPAIVAQWDTGARLIQGKYLATNTTGSENSNTDMSFDSNVGWNSTSYWSSIGQSWMWKRGAGFDVVTYKGDSVAGRQMPHSLGVVPEMMWVKCRNAGEDWAVYHKGLNGGTDPEDYFLMLQSDGAEGNADWHWNDTAPTSTLFTLGTNGKVNYNNNTYIAMLFASVDGISKVGSWTGSGVSGKQIVLGFEPRFLVFKRTDVAADWLVYDSLRNSGEDLLELNTSDAQATWGVVNFAQVTNGFQINNTSSSVNASGGNYIYYAHA